MDLESIGAQIKEERKSRGWTRDQLAEMANVSSARIESLENRRASDFGIIRLLRLLHVLGLDLRVTNLNKSRPTLDDLRAEEEEL